ncbi:sensor domain-containing diguanylate cyclase [Herbaspirillum sp. RTI4]|uniref:sensor domain-containing diguanylate cyclase n=1 Tax=Herbaspirillum sp. RTI4 TaxID=3048640 RepID=UPI002AB53D4B|nr:sensor domain-containing diguanylate cyclase [Herbaspirillum sp. RTI4]MDY7578580.1 sensor domain-containing diguanylate cyclase [Herbaspirillum sp. RTI4]MEA9981114.1 sensor domain-containing diguanylate cyclase [Herbaspirillum sp. RTI4]
MTTTNLPLFDSFPANTLHAFGFFNVNAEMRFDRLSRLARRLFNVPIAFVSMVDARNAITKTPHVNGLTPHASDDILIVPDTVLDARFNDSPLVTGSPNIRFYAGCPISIGNGEKLGTLCLIDQQPRSFDAADLALLLDLAQMADQELAAMELATIDELTKLYNRRGFEAAGSHGLSLCARLETPVSMLYFDLDMFKCINDRFGHAEGDFALKNFARILTETLRKSDVIGRLGGDEFAVLLTNTSPAQAARTLQHLEQAVRGYNGSNERGYELRYSVGYVQYQPTLHPTLAELMQHADTLMYENKKQSPNLIGKTVTRFLKLVSSRK